MTEIYKKGFYTGRKEIDVLKKLLSRRYFQAKNIEIKLEETKSRAEKILELDTGELSEKGIIRLKARIELAKELLEEVKHG